MDTSKHSQFAPSTTHVALPAMSATRIRSLELGNGEEKRIRGEMKRRKMKNCSFEVEFFWFEGQGGQMMSAQMVKRGREGRKDGNRARSSEALKLSGYGGRCLHR